MAYKKHNQRGFTIVELMIAIAVFAVTMLVVTMGIIQVARSYKQASTRLKIEDASREMHAQIAQAVQYSGSSVQTPGPVSGYNVVCVGSQRYLWKQADVVVAGEVSLYVDKIAGPSACTTTPFVAANAQTPLPANTKVVNFSVGSSNTSTISTRFVIGEKDMFVGTDYNNNCVSSVIGSEFCAVVELNSTVARKAIKL